MNTSKRSTQTITIRPRLTVHRVLDPLLYDTLEAIPERLRGDFILYVLQRAARGDAHPMRPHEAAYHASPPAPSASVPAADDRPSALTSVDPAKMATQSAAVSTTPTGLKKVWAQVTGAGKHEQRSER